MPRGATCSSESSPSATSPRTRPPAVRPTEAERIKAMVTIAHKAEEVGLDVFATGEHHNPPVRAVLPDHDARLHRRADRQADPVDVDHADHHQRPGQDRRGLRDAAAPGRRPGRPDDGPRQHRPGLPVVRSGHPRRHRAGDRELRPAAPAVARGRRRLGGQVPYAAAGLHLDPAAAGRRAAVRLARLDPQPRDRRAGRLLRRRVLRQPHLLAHQPLPAADRPLPQPLRALRPRPRRPGDRRARRAGVHPAELPGRDRASSGPTSTTPRSTATARRWRSSCARPR